MTHLVCDLDLATLAAPALAAATGGNGNVLYYAPTTTLTATDHATLSNVQSLTDIVQQYSVRTRSSAFSLL
jgi:hypothetical protein